MWQFCSSSNWWPITVETTCLRVGQRSQATPKVLHDVIPLKTRVLKQINESLMWEQPSETQNKRFSKKAKSIKK